MLGVLPGVYLGVPECQGYRVASRRGLKMQ